MTKANELVTQLKQQEQMRTFEISYLPDYLKRKGGYALPVDPRVKRLTSYKGYKVFLVDGKKIRHHIDIDFVMGGNGCRYLYCPLEEIWVDSSFISSEEIDFIVHHEYVELELMKKGWNYNDAHDAASEEEFLFRRQGTVRKNPLKVNTLAAARTSLPVSRP